MSIFIRNFRQWWQPPRNLADRPAHRQVTFLELFYDLVYVVLIAELTHTLSTHIDLAHVGEFAFLFVIVIWAWLNGTLYYELHGNNDIRTRVFTFAQMFTVAAMAVFAHDALGETSVGFALAYAAFQIILTYLWWRTGVHDPHHRPLSRPYTVAFLLTTAAFVASAFVEPPLRFYIWGIAMAVSALLPLSMFGLRRVAPEVQEQMELSSTATPSLVERFGLFTIIVMGEVLVGVVQGVAGHNDLTLEVGIIGALGMAIAFSIWWLYFDSVSHRPPRKGRGWLLAWMYAHAPVTAGIAIIGAAVLNVVEHAGEALPLEVRWLLVVAIALVLVGIAILIRTVEPYDGFKETFHVVQIAMLIVAGVILALGFSALQTIPLLLVLVVLMLLPVGIALTIWIKQVEVTGDNQAYS